MQKYLIVMCTVVCVSVMWIMMKFVVQAENTADIDRGYECFNLEIAQAQLMDARTHSSWWEIIKAYRSVKNWEKLCGE